jgi:hypothetical protein
VPAAGAAANNRAAESANFEIMSVFSWGDDRRSQIPPRAQSGFSTSDIRRIAKARRALYLS